jgi:hypothetical protein
MTIKRAIVQAVGAALIATAQASSASAGPSQSEIGEARCPCATWSAARQQPDMAVRKASISSWILGFVSGINVHTPEVDFLADKDPNSIWLSVDTYCDEHPSHSIGEAVSSLAMQMYRSNGIITAHNEKSFRLIKPVRD